MALTHRQQQAYVQEGADFLMEGHSLATWEEKLQEDGLYPFDINKLHFQLEKELGDRFSSSFQAELEETATATNQYGLAEDVFTGVLRQQQQHFRKTRDARTRLLAREDLTVEEIYEELAHPLYKLEDVQHVLQKEKNRKEFKEVEGGLQGATGGRAVMIGAITLVTGIALSMVLSGEGYVTIFYGMILFGIIMIGKGLFDR